MDETFQVFDRVLSFAGIPLFAKRNWNSKKWLLFQCFNVLIGFITFLFTTTFVLTNISDLFLCIQGACVWTTGVIMFISLCICLIFRTKLRSFLEEMVFQDRTFDMPLVHNVFLMKPRHGKLFELMELVINSQEKLFKLSRVLLKTYLSSVWLCVTLYLCGPIYLMCIRKNKSLRLLGIHSIPITICCVKVFYENPDGKNISNLARSVKEMLQDTYQCYNTSKNSSDNAFDMWFPYELENFGVYVASFTFHAYAGYLCCIAYPGIQSMIILLVGQINRQIRILTFILKNLDEIGIELVGKRGDVWHEVCFLIFTQCADHYIKTKRFANKLNLICQPFYLALIIVATMLVCVCSVKIAISDKLSPDTTKYYIHELCFIVMVLMFCFLGQQLENESEKLEAAVIEKWYIFNLKHQTNILIFRMALSQRMPIYIFGSITLSLPTFTWFIRTGMSFFTFLMSVLED